jgi:hypothetical protein
MTKGIDYVPERDEYIARPRKASRREVNRRLDRIALGLSALHEEVSELRHELGVVRRIEEPPPRRNYESE